MADSRTNNAMRNVKVAVACQIINTVISLVSRTIFIHTLGRTYLGVSGLFSNILTIMSLAELGIGDAIVFRMYKPMAEEDHEKVKSYMQFYRKAYWIIGIFVFCVGLTLLPFLPKLISDTRGIEHLRLIYVLYLFNTASSYFFAYKKLIIVTDQKGYIDTYNRYFFLAIQSSLQIAALMLFKNFIVYLCIQIVMNFIANISIAHKATKMYPYLKGKAQPLASQEKRDIFKQTSALVTHKIGGVCVSGTDNLLLSKFVGIDWVGVYSNYVTLLAIPQTLLAYIFSPLTASIGNLVSTSEREHIRETFDKLFFTNFWLYGLCAVTLFTLLNSFIGSVWLDSSYELTTFTVFFIVFNFYLTGMRQIISSFKSVSGLFWNDRFRPLAEALVNLVASIILLKFYGFPGVVIGTTISTLTTTVWVEGVIVFRHVLKDKVQNFFMVYVKYLIVLFAVGSLTYLICNLIPVGGVFSFVLKTVVCVVLCNICFLALFFRTRVFRELLKMLMVKIRKKGKVYEDQSPEV